MPVSCCGRYCHEQTRLQTSVVPPEIRTSWPIPHRLSAHISSAQVDALLAIAALVIDDHVRSQKQRQHNAESAESGSRRQSRNVVRSVFVPEDVGRNHAHHVRYRYAQRGQKDTPAFVRDVVIVPDIKQYRWRGSAPAHHESGEVGHCVRGLDVDGSIDDEAAESEEEAEGDEWEAPTRVIGGEGEDEQHYCAGYVGCLLMRQLGESSQVVWQPLYVPQCTDWS